VINTINPPVTPVLNQSLTKKNLPILPFIIGFIVASIIIGLGIVTIIFGPKLFSSALLTQSSLSKKPISQTKTDLKTMPKTNKQWTNCSDVRDILEEGEKIYVACLGGVIIANKSTGEVLDQITMTQGLGNNVTTSLVKQGDVLYIGTQDGFTRFNLKTRQAKKISVKDGLISGANIYLALDGDNLWVGTFEGLNLYNTVTGSISAFTKEVADNARKFGVNKVFITPLAVYTLAQANADTPGAVARFDKQSMTWERFGPSAFLSSLDQYSRIDMFDFASVDNKVYVTDMNHVWQADDKQGAVWKKIDSIEPMLKNIQSPYIQRLFTYNNKLYVLVSNLIYTLNNGALQTVYPPSGENKNVLTNTSGNQPMPVNNTVYATTNDGWIVGVDLDSLKPFSITLNARPTQFGSFLAKIDDSLLFCSLGTVWEYNNKASLFKKQKDTTCPSMNMRDGTNAFIPIPGSNEIFIFSQECGMGCGKAQITIFNYEYSSARTQQMPPDYMSALTKSLGEWDYPALIFKQYDSVNSKVIFTLTTYTADTPKTVTIPLDLKTLLWDPSEIEKTSDTQTNIPNASFCNPFYGFETNNNKFTSIECKEKADNGEYSFSLVETTVDKEGNKKTYRLAKENMATKKVTQLDFPKGADLPYSPFGTSFYSTGFNKLTVFNNKVFIPSNTGIFIYDIKKGGWTVLTTKDGLISNNVTDYIADENNLWAITEWGGLSKISYNQ